MLQNNESQDKMGSGGGGDLCPGGEEASLVLSTPRPGVSCDSEKAPASDSASGSGSLPQWR